MSNIIYEETRHGYVFKAVDAGEGRATVDVSKNGGIVRQFSYPTYKVWNIIAHAQELAEALDQEAAVIEPTLEVLASWAGLLYADQLGRLGRESVSRYLRAQAEKLENAERAQPVVVVNGTPPDFEERAMYTIEMDGADGLTYQAMNVVFQVKK